MHTPKCIARHLGIWSIDPVVLSQGLDLVRAGRDPLHPRASSGDPQPPTLAVVMFGAETRVVRDESNRTLYSIDSEGVAIVDLAGALVKGSDKFGTDTLRMRRAIRAMASNPDVRAVFMVVDSPGGTVAGIDELAIDVRNLSAQKPVFAHVEYTMGSAAYWVGAQAKRITATESSEVGSIGVYASIVDASERAAMEGLKVHLLSSGGMKGAGEPGTPVTDAQLAYFQSRIDNVAEQFVSAIVDGRPKLSRGEVKKMADGRMHSASDAKALGLIDAKARMDEAMEDGPRAYVRKKKAAKARANALGAVDRQIALDV